MIYALLLISILVFYSIGDYCLSECINILESITAMTVMLAIYASVLSEPVLKRIPHHLFPDWNFTLKYIVT